MKSKKVIEVMVEGRTFHVKVRDGEDGYLIAQCVELSAALTQGKKEKEVVRNIKEAIGLVLEDMEKSK